MCPGHLPLLCSAALCAVSRGSWEVAIPVFLGLLCLGWEKTPDLHKNPMGKSSIASPIIKRREEYRVCVTCPQTQSQNWEGGTRASSIKRQTFVRKASQFPGAASFQQGTDGVLRWMGTDAVLPPLPKDLLTRRTSPKNYFPSAHEMRVLEISF